MKWILLSLVVIYATQNFAYGRNCKKAEDCKEGECCVQISVVTTLFGGLCRKLRQEGESCIIIKDKEEKPDMYHFQCPCKDDLKCVLQNEIKIFDHVKRYRAECVAPGKEEETTTTPNPSFPDISPA